MRCKIGLAVNGCAGAQVRVVALKKHESVATIQFFGVRVRVSGWWLGCVAEVKGIVAVLLQESVVTVKVCWMQCRVCRQLGCVGKFEGLVTVLLQQGVVLNVSK